MSTLMMVIHVTACVLLVLLVLVQSGKDGGMGMMAGGTSQSVFGSSGGANFFTKFTSIVATIFMITSIGLTVAKSGGKKSVFDSVSHSQIPLPSETAPVAPATPAAPEAKK